MTFVTRRVDVLVIGTGVAGLTAALHAEGRRVLVVTKSRGVESGSSPRAQGGVAVALGPDDSPRQHLDDTLCAGAGLSRNEVVASITAEGPARIAELLELGLRLDRDSTGGLALGREGAHSCRRVVHAKGDATGAELVRTLKHAVRAASWIEIEDQMFVLDVIVHRGRVVGADAIDRDGRSVRILATAVVLANGGIGQLFAATTNPAEATGDGLAMAARAGATLAGLEMVQFHPTALADEQLPMALITEALRGEGARLLDEHGRRFMCDEHEMAEMAPRDVVARAIWSRRRNGHDVVLDATALSRRLGERFPTVVSLCAARGIDPRTTPIPVTPAAHYHMGGVVTDLDGRTSVPGLWACGEVASTGLHGANRLASNSLLEALVMGARVGEALRRGSALAVLPTSSVSSAVGVIPRLEDDPDAAALAGRLRDLMWCGAGLVRTALALRQTMQEVEDLQRGVAENRMTGGELVNLLLVGRLLLQAAMARTESRGAHYRADFPHPSPCWRQELIFDGTAIRRPRPILVDQSAAG